MQSLWWSFFLRPWLLEACGLGCKMAGLQLGSPWVKGSGAVSYKAGFLQRQWSQKLTTSTTIASVPATITTATITRYPSSKYPFRLFILVSRFKLDSKNKVILIMKGLLGN